MLLSGLKLLHNVVNFAYMNKFQLKHRLVWIANTALFLTIIAFQLWRLNKFYYVMAKCRGGPSDQWLVHDYDSQFLLGSIIVVVFFGAWMLAFYSTSKYFAKSYNRIWSMRLTVIAAIPLTSYLLLAGLIFSGLIFDNRGFVYHQSYYSPWNDPRSSGISTETFYSYPDCSDFNGHSALSHYYTMAPR